MHSLVTLALLLTLCAYTEQGVDTYDTKDQCLSRCSKYGHGWCHKKPPLKCGCSLEFQNVVLWNCKCEDGWHGKHCDNCKEGHDSNTRPKCIARDYLRSNLGNCQDDCENKAGKHGTCKKYCNLQHLNDPKIEYRCECDTWYKGKNCGTRRSNERDFETYDLLHPISTTAVDACQATANLTGTGITGGIGCERSWCL